MPPRLKVQAPSKEARDAYFKDDTPKKPPTTGGTRKTACGALLLFVLVAPVRVALDSNPIASGGPWDTYRCTLDEKKMLTLQPEITFHTLEPAFTQLASLNLFVDWVHTFHPAYQPVVNLRPDFTLPADKGTQVYDVTSLLDWYIRNETGQRELNGYCIGLATTLGAWGVMFNDMCLRGATSTLPMLNCLSLRQRNLTREPGTPAVQMTPSQCDALDAAGGDILAASLVHPDENRMTQLCAAHVSAGGRQVWQLFVPGDIAPPSSVEECMAILNDPNFFGQGVIPLDACARYSSTQYQASSALQACASLSAVTSYAKSQAEIAAKNCGDTAWYGLFLFTFNFLIKTTVMALVGGVLLTNGMKDSIGACMHHFRTTLALSCGWRAPPARLSGREGSRLRNGGSWGERRLETELTERQHGGAHDGGSGSDGDSDGDGGEGGGAARNGGGGGRSGSESRTGAVVTRSPLTSVPRR